MLRTIITLTTLLIFNSSFAATVLPVSLENMAENAAVIFYGRVISNEVKLDDVSQRVATFTTFEVLDAIRGVETGSYTLKQIGGQLPGSQLVTRVYGVPRFTENAEYVVFLPQASQLGFASPIGLSQGSYRVSTDNNGIKTVGRRGATGQNDTKSSPALRASPGPNDKTALADFLQNVRTLSGH
jgi:hypothetical protein